MIEGREGKLPPADMYEENFIFYEWAFMKMLQWIEWLLCVCVIILMNNLNASGLLAGTTTKTIIGLSLYQQIIPGKHV